MGSEFRLHFVSYSVSLRDGRQITAAIMAFSTTSFLKFPVAAGLKGLNKP